MPPMTPKIRGNDQLEFARFGIHQIAITAPATAIRKADADEPTQLQSEKGRQ
jgi:hypothetical protein